MACLSCGLWGSGPVCRSCRSELRRVPPRRLPDGLVVFSAFLHEGAARRLVHRLKYEAVEGVAPLLARAMLPLIPSNATALVPIPRVVWRRVRFGVDPGVALAVALSRLTGLQVLRALDPQLFGPSHAGRSRSDRRPPIFTARHRASQAAVLVDDVLTTGGTLASARSVLVGGPALAVTATAAGPVTSLGGGEADGAPTRRAVWR